MDTVGADSVDQGYVQPERSRLQRKDGIRFQAIEGTQQTRQGQG